MKQSTQERCSFSNRSFIFKQSLYKTIVADGAQSSIVSIRPDIPTYLHSHNDV